MTEATLSYAQEPTPSLLEPTGPELLVNNNGSSYSNISVGTPTVTTTGAAVTASTTSTSSSTFKRRISLRARTLSVTLPSPSRTTPSTPSPIKGESSELMTSTNAEQSRVALIRRVSEKKSKASTVDTDDSVFVADITTNPYISFVAKRIRSLKKRVARIESTEELLRSDPEIKDRMALEQLQSVERKLDATAPLREFEDLLKLMTDQHIKDKKSEAERFREAEKLREAARKYEEAEARREEAQRQTSVTSFIQLVRLFYALKELEGAEEHLEDNLLQSLCTLDMFRSKLFEAAEAAELTNEGSQRQRLYDFVMDMTSRSSKPVSDVGSLTFNDVLVELDNITNPSQKTQQRGSDDVEDDSDPQSKMASPELSPSKAEYTNAVVENWLDESQQQSALPLSTATPPISSSEKGLTEEIFASVEDIQATLQTTPHDQSTTVQGKANEEATRGGAKHPVMEGSNSRALIPAGSSASNGGHRKFGHSKQPL
ncbi:hypothetical protein BGZ83_011793 [Gryganskiella cystojenkinii]|nr:hypothetical protein BGZ83_011793 [Gryganskiella cystojenkinii]